MIINDVEIKCLNDLIKNFNGVYCIRNILNDKRYVGSSASKLEFASRFSKHICHLNNNTHHSRRLQNSFNKNDKNYNFYEFEILEFCDKSICIEREQYWIDFYDSYNFGYNSTRKAKSMLGFKYTDESKKNKSRSSQKFTEEMVIDIFKRYHEGESSIEIAKIHNTSSTAIICTLNWANYYPAIKEKYNLTIDNLYKYVLISPEGVVHKIRILRIFCKEHNLHSGAMLALLTKSKRKKNTYKGWKGYYKKDYNENN